MAREFTVKSDDLDRAFGYPCDLSVVRDMLEYFWFYNKPLQFLTLIPAFFHEMWTNRGKRTVVFRPVFILIGCFVSVLSALLVLLFRFIWTWRRRDEMWSHMRSWQLHVLGSIFAKSQLSQFAYKCYIYINSSSRHDAIDWKARSCVWYSKIWRLKKEEKDSMRMKAEIFLLNKGISKETRKILENFLGKEKKGFPMKRTDPSL